MNKKGGTFLIGILFVVMGIIVLMGVSPAIEEQVIEIQRNASFNCVGASDYDSDIRSNTLGCTISDLMVPLLILGVVIAGIMIIYSGKPQTEPQYPTAYGGY